MKRIWLAFIFILASLAIYLPAGAATGATHTKPYKIALIIKATDSDFWQYVIIGAVNYGLDNPDKAKVSWDGPKSEADIEKQVSLLEDIISKKPDGIVIASTSSDSTVPALENAIDQGIAVVTIDNKVHSDKIPAFLATNNKVGGALCADQMVANLKAKGVPLKGTIGLISAMAGIQVLTDRDGGFRDRMKEIAPDINVLETRFTDNDIARALAAAEDIGTSQGDKLIGVFADNNHTGDGVARMITERNLGDKIVAVAYDSDPEEVSALKSGALKALILQDPYGMGYKGCATAVTLLEGGTVPKYIDTGVVAVTQANMNDKKILDLLDPTRLKR
ncbi:MAG: ABC transporter substrate-binding protein [Verrucomicrobia bacterium]|nr:ABC transporter substrate-binding protein [Verrucomicrobiota bacterium]MBV9645576.1 ABC transporter substrate-binding protein [Verrucomicrobiota bacterium]